MSEEKEKRLVAIMKEVVSKLTPAVTQFVDRDASGSLEIHFAQGQLKTSKIKDLTL